MAVQKNMKAQIRRNLKEMAKERRRVMAKRLRDKKKEIVQHVIDTIRDDIRNNATNPKTGKQFKQLKYTSIQNRQRIAKKNPTHPNYKLMFPNLTITGRFLNGMRGKMKGGVVKGFDISLFFKGVHKKYKPLTNRKAKNAKRNKVMNTDIHEGMINIGRDPLGLSKKAFREVNKFVMKELTEAFKRK